MYIFETFVVGGSHVVESGCLREVLSWALHGRFCKLVWSKCREISAHRIGTYRRDTEVVRTVCRNCVQSLTFQRGSQKTACPLLKSLFQRENQDPPLSSSNPKVQEKPPGLGWSCHVQCQVPEWINFSQTSKFKEDHLSRSRFTIMPRGRRQARVETRPSRSSCLRELDKLLLIAAWWASRSLVLTRKGCSLPVTLCSISFLGCLSVASICC